MSKRPDLIPLRGAVSEPLLMEISRELTLEDLNRLSSAPKVNVPVLQKIRAIHHRQAELLAQGKSLEQVAAIVGCTPQRLVQLKQDQTFNDLVNYYQDQTMLLMLKDSARLKDKLVDVGEMAVDELRERLENDEVRKKIRTGEIRQIAEFAMDRTVAPPITATNQSLPPAAITINFGTPIKNSQNDSKVIEGEVEE